MQSPEYPELPFVQPAAYGTGRDGRKVMYSVIHYTAGAERSTSAEDGAAYDQRRTDGTSCHFFHDQNSTVQCVLTWNRSNSAFSKGNRLGVHHELCGTQQTRAQWLDEASYGTLRQAARWVAEDCKKYGLPVRKMTPAEVRASWYTANSAGPKGICGHADITLAYPEDGGDHMDPGTEFPWDVFLPLVQAYVGGAPIPSVGDDDMTPEQAAALARVDGRLAVLYYDMPNNPYAAGTMNGETNQLRTRLAKMGDQVQQLVTAAGVEATRDAGTRAVIDAMAAAITGAGGDVDTAQILAGVDAAVQRATAPLIAQINELTEQVEAKDHELRTVLAEAAHAAADKLDS